MAASYQADDLILLCLAREETVVQLAALCNSHGLREYVNFVQSRNLVMPIAGFCVIMFILLLVIIELPLVLLMVVDSIFITLFWYSIVLLVQLSLSRNYSEQKYPYFIHLSQFGY